MTDKSKWLQDAYNAIERALHDSSFSDIDFVFDGISIEWEMKNTRYIACANYHKGYIKLNYNYWQHLTDQERYDVTIHEMAHIITTYYFDSYGKSVSSHGKEWKNCMRKLGVKNPKATTKIKNINAYFEIRGNRVPAYCCCEEPHMISKTKYNRILKGEVYICKTCKQNLSLKKEC